MLVIPQEVTMKQIRCLFHFGFIVTLMKKLLLFIILLCLWPVLGNATVYYVANAGNDSCNGTSSSLGSSGACAWKTIAHVNARTFNPGDSILFQAGGTWREQLTVPSSGSAGSPITFGAYGSGAQPVIDGTNLIVPGSSWSLYTKNIWQATVTTQPNIVFFNGTRGTIETSVANLTAPEEWYWASNILYTYATSSPDILYTRPGVEPAQRSDALIIANRSYVTVNGLKLTRTNSDIVLIGGSGSNATVENSEISWGGRNGIGIYNAYRGSNLFTLNAIHDLPGNGVNTNHTGSGSGTQTIMSQNQVYNCAQFGIFGEVNYYIIENNIFHDNGKNTVLGPPGQFIAIEIYSSGSDGAGQNNIVRYNTIYNQKSCGNDGGAIEFDLYTTGNQAYYNVAYNNDGPGITLYGARSNSVYNNTFYNDSQNSCGQLGSPSEIRLTGTSTPVTSNTLVKNNIAYATGTSTYPIYVDSYTYNQTLSISNNDFYAPNSSDFYFWHATGGNSLSTFNALTGVSANLNSNPLFVSTSTPNLNLRAGSPAIYAGVNVGLTTDYEGNQVHNPPSMGVYEYGEKTVPAAPQNLRIDAQ
jgi:hypothetical protein